MFERKRSVSFLSYESLEEWGEVSMGEYKDSFLTIFGVNDASIDIFDNPYFTYNVYHLTDAWTPKIHPTINLRTRPRKVLMYDDFGL